MGARLRDVRALWSMAGGPPLSYSVAGFVVCRRTRGEAQAEVARITDVKQSARGYDNCQDWVANTRLERRMSIEDYSVSNRGLRSGLVGTPRDIADRILEFRKAGGDLLLLQFSPQEEEMESFAEEVIPLVRQREAETGGARGGSLNGLQDRVGKGEKGPAPPPP